MKKEIRFKIARWLDKKYPNLCWAMLVMWAEGYHSFWQAFNREDGEVYQQMCRKKNKATPYAYCGKCEQNGNFKGEERATKPTNKDWKKEFDKHFTRDDGLIDKYSWYGISNEAEEQIGPNTTSEAIKQFIETLLSTQRDTIKRKIDGKIKKMDKALYADVEDRIMNQLSNREKIVYNQALQDILKEL